jgi:hypothetical protein
MLHPHMVMADSIHGIDKERKGAGGKAMELPCKEPEKFQPDVPKLST